MPKRTTLADIARAAEVSVATVSMVLNRREGSRVSEATAERVRRAARELGYVPDVAARTLRTGRSKVLGFISDEVTVTRFASGMVRGILEGADKHGHGVMIMEIDHRAERLEQAVRTLRARRVDALLIGFMASREIEVPLGDWAVPLVAVNGSVPGATSVLPDEPAAGRASVEYLLRHGHRRIAMVGHHPAPQPTSLSVNIWPRMQGIDQAMADAGLDFVARHDGTDWEPPLGYEGTFNVLNAEPTAILAANDRIAFGVYQALQERGLRVPDDVSVMSFDDEELAGMLRPGLTTLRLPYSEMGSMAVDIALGHAPHLVGQQQCLLPLGLVERDSVQTI
ncbi:LacI family DNA-binding transcriptional regulator [uncultured Tessaracoccus sp.]|uniref:LacI family DNA-binding transcriptional regulator n=1 Tax=uncultured Tessaracoccus sp. TaxID=905023 RepID=UPI0026151F32|nr:LacI family DNA-binding transcriptional regulator [uncultured Tessaracoccus sp.]